MEIRVLGPLVVSDRNAPVALGGPQQQTVLAVLLARANTVVSTDRLIDEVWGESPPDTARKAVQSYVAQLRKAVNRQGEVLRSESPGYVLEVSSNQVDSLRFEEMVREGRSLLASQPEAAAARLHEALALWRGSAFAGLADEAPTLRTEAARLEEVRLSTLEDRIEADLALGRHSTLIGELEVLAAEHPLRERMWAQLMMGLYRSGRQAEALGAYQKARRVLGEGLGIEPSPKLRNLEERVLLQTETFQPMMTETRGNLPVRLTSFFGRTQEIAELLAWIPERRLISISGIGGIGKTSLALEVARAVQSKFSDGAWIFDLSPFTDRDGLATAMALGLNIPLSDELPVEETLVRHLGGRQVLLLADSCGGVVDRFAPMLYRLLTSCPGLNVLTTSRVPLGVDGEAELRLTPLALPEPSSDPQTILEHDVVRLFRDRAVLVGREDQVTSQTAAAVAQICSRLEGIPLAIELGAARLRTLSLRDLSDQLEARFVTLVGRSRTTPERHRTLLAAMDWSYELLDPQQKRLLRRLSVFGSRFTLQAAATVCSDHRLRRRSIGSVLEELAHTSMLKVTWGAETTFELLDTMKEYAEIKLTESGESAKLRRRHRRYVRARERRNAIPASPWSAERRAALARSGLGVGHDVLWWDTEPRRGKRRPSQKAFRGRAGL